MIRKLLPVLFLLSALLLLACAKHEEPATTNAGPAVAKPAATQPASSTTATSDKIGVPECDDYLAKYDSCISGKVPELARAQYKASFEQTRKSWQQIAATPQGKASLAAACKQATEAAKTAMKSFNCTF